MCENWKCPKTIKFIYEINLINPPHILAINLETYVVLSVIGCITKKKLNLSTIKI